MKILFYIAILVSCYPVFAENDILMIGDWEFHATENCSELYVFKENNILVAKSNKEIITRSFTRKKISNQKFLVTFTQLNTNGLSSCSGEIQNREKGYTFQMIMTFDDSSNMFYMSPPRYEQFRIGPFTKKKAVE